jgi:hypothetical protein
VGLIGGNRKKHCFCSFAKPRWISNRRQWHGRQQPPLPVLFCLLPMGLVCSVLVYDKAKIILAEWSKWTDEQITLPLPSSLANELGRKIVHLLSLSYI